jgi:hypothetical protein
LLPSGPGQVPPAKAVGPPLQEGLRHRRPHGAGFIADAEFRERGSPGGTGYWPRLTPSARGGGELPALPAHPRSTSVRSLLAI